MRQFRLGSSTVTPQAHSFLRLVGMPGRNSERSRRLWQPSQPAAPRPPNSQAAAARDGSQASRSAGPHVLASPYR